MISLENRAPGHCHCKSQPGGCLSISVLCEYAIGAHFAYCHKFRQCFDTVARRRGQMVQSKADQGRVSSLP